MSYRCHVDKLSTELQLKIKKDCTLVDKSFKNFSKYNKKPPETCSVFKNTDGYCHLPYNYACNLFNIPLLNSRQKYEEFSSFEFNTDLRDYQREVSEIANKNYTKYGTCFFNVFCSWGKTVIGTYYASLFAKKFNVATFILHPRKNIGESWLGTISRFTNAKVYIYGVTAGEPEPDTQIYICLYHQFHNVKEETIKRIGHLIVDEADMFCTQNLIEHVLSFNPLFTTILTATCKRKDGYHKALDLIVGPEKITKISKKTFYVIRLNTKLIPTETLNRAGKIDYTKLVQSMNNCDYRNWLIIYLVLYNPEKKIGILVKHVDHAETLANSLDTIYASYGTNHKVARLYGSNNKKKYNDSHCIVGTYSKISVGWDEKDSCSNWNGIRINMGILAASKEDIEQTAGRFFRADTPIIWEFIDDHRIFKKHSKTREDWYFSRNGKVFDVDTIFNWESNKHLFDNQPTVQQPAIPLPPTQNQLQF